MAEEERPDLFQQLWDFLSQLLFPNWPDLIALLPLVFIGLIAVVFLVLALMWRRAGARNRSRVPRRLATGSPPPGIHMPGPSRWPFVAPIGLMLIFFALIVGGLPLFVLGLVVSALAAFGWMRDAMREWRTTEIGHHATAVAVGHTGARRLGGGAAAVALTAGPTVAVEPAPWEMEPPPGVHMPGPSPWPFFAPIGLTLVLFGLILSPWLILGGLLLGIIAAAGWLRDASREWHSTERVGHAVPATRDPRRAWPRRLVPFLATIVALSMALALLPLGLNWLGSLAPGPATPTPVEVPAVPEISAFNSLSFDREVLIVPADSEFTLVFHNEEAGVPHNVEISQTAARDTVYFEGEIIEGVATVEYQVPALAQGEHYFLCAVHPNMNGTVEAMPEAGGPPADGASPGPASPGAASPGSGEAPSP